MCLIRSEINAYNRYLKNQANDWYNNRRKSRIFSGIFKTRKTREQQFLESDEGEKFEEEMENMKISHITVKKEELENKIKEKEEELENLGNLDWGNDSKNKLKEELEKLEEQLEKYENCISTQSKPDDYFETNLIPYKDENDENDEHLQALQNQLKELSTTQQKVFNNGGKKRRRRTKRRKH